MAVELISSYGLKVGDVISFGMEIYDDANIAAGINGHRAQLKFFESNGTTQVGATELGGYYGGADATYQETDPYLSKKENITIPTGAVKMELIHAWDSKLATAHPTSRKAMLNIGATLAPFKLGTPKIFVTSTDPTTNYDVRNGDIWIDTT